MSVRVEPWAENEPEARRELVRVVASTPVHIDLRVRMTADDTEIASVSVVCAHAGHTFVMCQASEGTYADKARKLAAKADHFETAMRTLARALREGPHP